MKLTSLVVKSLVTLLIGGATLGTNLQAQSESVTVNVPFSFTVGTQSIAAGTYKFRLLSSQFLLSVLNVKTGNVELFSVRPEQQRAVEQHGRLVFHNSEGLSALSQIHFPGTDTFTEVSQLHGARRMEAIRSSMANSIVVAQR